MPTKEQDLASFLKTFENTSLSDLISERNTVQQLLKDHTRNKHRGNLDQDCSVCQSLRSDLVQHNIVIRQRQQPPRP